MGLQLCCFSEPLLTSKCLFVYHRLVVVHRQASCTCACSKAQVSAKPLDKQTFWAENGLVSTGVVWPCWHQQQHKYKSKYKNNTNTNTNLHVCRQRFVCWPFCVVLSKKEIQYVLTFLEDICFQAFHFGGAIYLPLGRCMGKGWCCEGRWRQRARGLRFHIHFPPVGGLNTH